MCVWWWVDVVRMRVRVRVRRVRVRRVRVRVRRIRRRIRRGGVGVVRVDAVAEAWDVEVCECGTNVFELRPSFDIGWREGRRKFLGQRDGEEADLCASHGGDGPVHVVLVADLSHGNGEDVVGQTGCLPHRGEVNQVVFHPCEDVDDRMSRQDLWTALDLPPSEKVGQGRRVIVTQCERDGPVLRGYIQRPSLLHKAPRPRIAPPVDDPSNVFVRRGKNCTTHNRGE